MRIEEVDLSPLLRLQRSLPWQFRKLLPAAKAEG